MWCISWMERFMACVVYTCNSTYESIRCRCYSKEMRVINIHLNVLKKNTHMHTSTQHARMRIRTHEHAHKHTSTRTRTLKRSKCSK